jgi:hypothetical protein
MMIKAKQEHRVRCLTRQLISAILVVVLMFTILPPVPEGGETPQNEVMVMTYPGSPPFLFAGDWLLWDSFRDIAIIVGFRGLATNIEIPSTLHGHRITQVLDGHGMFICRWQNIESIVIPDSVVSVALGLVAAPNLTTVTFTSPTPPEIILLDDSVTIRVPCGAQRSYAAHLGRGMNNAIICVGQNCDCPHIVRFTARVRCLPCRIVKDWQVTLLHCPDTGVRIRERRSAKFNQNSDLPQPSPCNHVMRE